MTTYHVELTGHCDVIVEANSEQEAFDRAIARIPSSSLSIETAEVKGVLEGEALKQAYRYFPEHLAMVDTSVFESEPVLYTKEMQEVNNQEYYKELITAKQNGEKLSWIQEDFLERYNVVVAVPVEDRWKTALTACFDEDDNFIGLVGKQENGLYKMVSK